MGNLVAIVGRPNVGKSTLFNRLTKSRQAIVNDEAGTTRDRQYGKTEWLGREFSVVDTGGWVVNSDDIFEGEIRKQVVLAMDEADVILFLVDVTNGVIWTSRLLRFFVRQRLRLFWLPIKRTTMICNTMLLNSINWVWGILIVFLQ